MSQKTLAFWERDEYRPTKKLLDLEFGAICEFSSRGNDAIDE
jgi:hypothetical protein